MTSLDTTTLAAQHDHLHRLAGSFLAGYRNANTRAAYRHQLYRWFAWCQAYGIDPLVAERVHIELYARWFEQQVPSINTVATASRCWPPSTDGSSTRK